MYETRAADQGPPPHIQRTLLEIVYTSGVWAAMDQRIIENAIAQWLQRLRACGKQKEDISNIFFNSIRKQKLLRTFFTKILYNHLNIHAKGRHTLLQNLKRIS